MQVGSDQGREASSASSLDRGVAFVAAFDDAVPVVHRYLFASTGGDAGLADELTAATFESAAQGFAHGNDGAVALGALLDAARAVLTARVSPLVPGLRRLRAPSGGSAVSGPDIADALRRLPLGHRVVLALRYHDHLPTDEVARAVDVDPAEVGSVLADGLAALGQRSEQGRAEDDTGSDDATAGERLTAVYAALDPPPADALVAGLRSRLRAEVEAAGRVRPAATPTTARRGPDPAAPPVDRAHGPAAPAAPPTPPGPVGGPVGGGGGRDGGDGAAAGDAVARGHRIGGAGRSASRHAVRAHDPGDVGSTGRDDAEPVPAPVAIEIEGSGETGTGGRLAQLTSVDPRPARPDAGRVRRERSTRTWIGVAAVVLLVVVGLAVAGAGGGDDPGRAAPASDPAPPRGNVAAGDSAAPSGTVPVRVIAPAEYVGVVVPEVTSEADVVARAHLGPGGPYMNGPYAVAAGDEGLWATAVGDDGTWQAVRIDPVTGATLARVRIPGRIPSDRSHHGLALSGGYVWAPALRDGLFRIDASTNTPSGIVGVAGGVVGAALDGGDGAVWAVGNDSVLRRIDSRTTEVTAAAMIPEMGLVPNGVDLTYGGSTVWVSVGDNAVRRLIGFDPVTLDRRYDDQVQPVGPLGDAYDIAADGDRVVVAEAPPGGVTVIDGAEGRVLASHQLQAAGIAVDGDRAWLLAPDDGRATVVWTRTGELIASAGVPPGVQDLVSTAEGGVWGAVPSTGDLVRLRFGG